MSENNEFKNNVEALFNGLDGFITTKSVVGEAVQVGDDLLIPIADVSFGLGASANAGSTKNNGGGGMGAKISPTALLMISKDGSTRLINIKDQDTISKLLDMAPDLYNRFMKTMKKDEPSFEE